MGSSSMFEAGLALNGLACFATPDISRDLANDVLSLVNTLCNTTTVNHIIDTITCILYRYSI